MKTNEVRLFIKPYCPWCDRAVRWLDQHGISHEILDVIENRQAMKEMIAISGQNLAPVIEVNGKVLADFGPDELDEWWHDEGFDKA